MAVELAHGTSTERFEALTYRLVAAKDGPDYGDRKATRLTALAACGNGHIASLSQHKIAPDGTVDPSLECPTTDCGWHERVRLLDWPPPRAVVPEQAGPGGLV